MSVFELLPWIAAAIFIAALFKSLLPRTRLTSNWPTVAALVTLFAGWTLFSVVSEGPFSFWVEHQRNAWSNQIWFDLLLAAGMGWTLLLPRARAVGMRPIPWMVFLICTGSIGLGLMFARCLYLEQTQPDRPAA